MGGDVHSDVANPAFPLPTVVSTGQHFQNHPHSLGTPIGALKDGFEKAVLTHDTPEPCELLSLNSCQKLVPVGPEGS